MRDRVKKIVIIGAAVLLGGCAYAVFYQLTGIGIPCPFHLITGLNCPGCGVTRMLVYIMHLDLGNAFRSNAVLFCMLPFLLLLLGYWLYRYIRFGALRNNRAVEIVCWVFVGILLIWGIVRNIIGM